MSKRLTPQEILKKSHEVHKGERVILNPEDYVGLGRKLNIECKKCGLIKPVNVGHHLNGAGCSKCSIIKKTKTNETFLEESMIANKGKWIPIEEYKGTHTKIAFKCMKCKNIFKQTPHNHLRGDGCTICKTSSKGNLRVKECLIEMGISHISEYRFKDCRDKRSLPFDFYLPEHNTCIEYDGVQHFKPLPYFGGTSGLESTKIRDGIKTKYCKDNNIGLLRISYNDINKIEEKIAQTMGSD